MRIESAVIAAFFAFSIAGCSGSKVSQANYDKINTGMTESEVEDILGKTEMSSSMDMQPPVQGIGLPGATNVSIPAMTTTVKTWKDGTKTISVTFFNGKVAAKAQNGL
jgi:hypothetical protein